MYAIFTRLDFPLHFEQAKEQWEANRWCPPRGRNTVVGARRMTFDVFQHVINSIRTSSHSRPFVSLPGQKELKTALPFAHDIILQLQPKALLWAVQGVPKRRSQQVTKR